MTTPTEVVEPAPARPRRRRWVVAAAAVATVALLAGVVTFLVVRSGKAAGTQVETLNLRPAAGVLLKGGTVQLPVGALAVTATTPLKRTPGGTDALADGAEIGRVHGFGRWVGVEWRVRPRAADPLDPAGRDPKQFQVVLVADGTRHDLGAGESADDTARARGYLGHKAVYLALPGEPTSLVLEVAYDGETQRLDLRSGKVDAGRAAPFYDAARRVWATSAPQCDRDPEIEAPGFTGDDPRSDGPLLSCEVSDHATVSPYVPGPGWAPAGRTWVTFWLTTNASLPFAIWPGAATGSPALYLLKLRSTAVTIAGAKPAATLPFYQQSAAYVQAKNLSGSFYVFGVPAGAPARAELHQEYADTDGPAKGAPAGAPREARGTFDLAVTLTPPR